MKTLNYLNILTAIEDCVKTDGLQVGVFTAKLIDIRNAYSEILYGVNALGVEANLIKRWHGVHESHIVFKNGSSIRVLEMSVNAIRYSFHKVLYEAEIDKEILGYVVRLKARP